MEDNEDDIRVNTFFSGDVIVSVGTTGIDDEDSEYLIESIKEIISVINDDKCERWDEFAYYCRYGKFPD